MTESRRSWMTAEARAADLRTVQSPSLRDVFRYLLFCSSVQITRINYANVPQCTIQVRDSLVLQRRLSHADRW